jgi:hypothetical protein
LKKKQKIIKITKKLKKIAKINKKVKNIKNKNCLQASRVGPPGGGPAWPEPDHRPGLDAGRDRRGRWRRRWGKFPRATGDPGPTGPRGTGSRQTRGRYHAAALHLQVVGGASPKTAKNWLKFTQKISLFSKKRQKLEIKKWRNCEIFYFPFPVIFNEIRMLC